MTMNDIFTKLRKTLLLITKGDYSVGKELETFLDAEKYPKEVVEFTETLDLMTIKLEAREIALRNTIKELENTNRCLVKSIKKREFNSGFFAGILLLIIVYIFLFALIQSFPGINSYMSRLIEISTVIFGVIVIRKSKLPLARFGLTTKGWKKSAVESLVFSGIIIMIMIGIKYLLLIKEVPGFGDKIFIINWMRIETFLYVPISFVQEFIARGIIQSALLISIVHKNKKLFAVLIAAGIFGSVHANYSIELALFSTLMSLGWGYLYIRTPNITGPVISHYLIGEFAWLLGYWDYFTKNPF
jgi:membrane protease YdiL (CAAX protease family)